jgi:Putative zinc-finger domain
MENDGNTDTDSLPTTASQTESCTTVLPPTNDSAAIGSKGVGDPQKTVYPIGSRRESKRRRNKIRKQLGKAARAAKRAADGGAAMTEKMTAAVTEEMSMCADESTKSEATATDPSVAEAEETSNTCDDAESIIILEEELRLLLASEASLQSYYDQAQDDWQKAVADLESYQQLSQSIEQLQNQRSQIISLQQQLASSLQKSQAQLEKLVASPQKKKSRKQSPVNSTPAAPQINPDIPLCPFELTGTCLDDACPFQHIGRRE